MDQFFVATAPGLERLAADELVDLGILEKSRTDRSVVEGGVAFEGESKQLYKANLHLRTASRVLVRLGDFYAAGFPELRKKAGRLAWERYLRPGQPVALHVTCRKSRLYHSSAVAERVAGAIQDRLRRPSAMTKASDASEEENLPQLVIVRLLHDHVTISIDSSGALLHRRGYRLETAKAPLRETLAAGMLLASGWNRTSPLLDPFCGSGTIAIEGALLANGTPPGCQRTFAFMDWPEFDQNEWDQLRSDCQEKKPLQTPAIDASDRDAGAVKIAAANASRAGVLDSMAITRRAVSGIEPPAEPGWVVTNPPYGIRVSGNKDLRNLYAQLGNVLRAKCPGWRVAILCNDLRLLAQTGLELDTSFSAINGGVQVILGIGEVPYPQGT